MITKRLRIQYRVINLFSFKKIITKGAFTENLRFVAPRQHIFVTRLSLIYLSWHSVKLQETILRWNKTQVYITFHTFNFRDSFASHLLP